MKKLITTLILLSTLACAEDGELKVVYDLTTKDLAKFEKNIIKSVAMNKAYYESKLQELHVSVVIHGGAYRFFVKDLKSSPFAADTTLAVNYEDLKKRICSLSETYEVEFLMCGAAMPRNKLTVKDIVSYVTIIPNSTVGLIDRQNEGYAYLPVRD